MVKKRHETGIIVPHHRLSADALQGLLEEFVSRDGTDSGYIQLTLQERVDQVRRQLERGEVLVVFDDVTKTANIMPAEDVATKD